ncbi:MAG: hypothetical protein F6K24_53430, partial [Okeania sp. SIO2D1]|nr:hypothetical protein [Okeania sp. SIO2D1]
YAIRFIDKVKVKGKSEWVAVYEVFEADEPKLREGKLLTKSVFEKACILYTQNLFREAAHLFQDCLRKNPSDRVAQIYLKRCHGHLSAAYLID